MAFLELEIARSRSSELIVQTLPDGSTAIFEVATKNVYSLNPSAAAAFEACASTTTLSQLAAAMSRRLSTPVTEDVAHAAASELAAVGLVSITAPEGFGSSRRDLLKQVAGVALPAVLVLTGKEQRAYAQNADSPPVVTTQPGGGSTTPPPPTTSPFCQTDTFLIVKKRGEDPNNPGTFFPLEGVEFQVRHRGTNALLETLFTDANGDGFVVSGLGPGPYKLVEILPPGSPYAPLGASNFDVGPNCEAPGWFDRTNFLLTTTGA